ncbi:MAG: membrane protein insertion efficiency factor YidD [Alphaproteobacteria bacterium]|nr:membrane protein insertion efficiency factor YidD [Alphaproteobacteria bacterium]MCB1839889.1 membrane protein insertion efficiency factor YidD [Alphaproteobacteria bacterium]
MDRALTRIFQSLIRLYAFCVSPLLGRNCRYEPTCSCYAHEALEKHGTLKGLMLTLSRLLRCHPWSNAHWRDPVPERFTAQALLRYKRQDFREPEFPKRDQAN